MTKRGKRLIAIVLTIIIVCGYLEIVGNRMDSLDKAEQSEAMNK